MKQQLNWYTNFGCGEFDFLLNAFKIQDIHLSFVSCANLILIKLKWFKVIYRPSQKLCAHNEIKVRKYINKEISDFNLQQFIKFKVNFTVSVYRNQFKQLKL